MADLVARARARRIAIQRNLIGFANDTKWGEFFAEVERLGIQLEMKYLGEEEPIERTHVWVPATNYVDCTFGPYLLVFVEWVRSSAMEDVTRIAKAVGLEYSIEGSKITVYGYR